MLFYFLSSVAVAVTLFIFISWSHRSSSLQSCNGPRSLKDTIPYVSNSYQYMTNNYKFMERVQELLKNSNLGKFNLGPKTIYLISGAHNVQTVFGSSEKVGKEVQMMSIVFPRVMGMPKHEVARFANDKSGRVKKPAPGTENQKSRPWYSYDHVHHEYLGKTQHLNKLSESFYRQISQKLDAQPVDEWVTVSIIDMCRNLVAQSALEALLSPAIFEMNPGFLEAFWDFDSVLFQLGAGLPSWLNPRPRKLQDRYFGMIMKYLDSAWENFDWNGPDAESDWEPNFGARVSREIVKWLREDGFCDRSAAGVLAVLASAQNSNSIPITTWVLMELIRDPSLLEVVRKEVNQTYTTDPATGSRTIDLQKLSVAPMLQSVFNETLRLRMSFNVTRQVKHPFELDGFTLKKGAILQTPMVVAHYNKAVWDSERHPADQFYAARHIKYVDEIDDSGKKTRKPTFHLARPNFFFPFGGGSTICPGRFFAKQEILLAVGLIITKFNIEFLEWTMLDPEKSPSNRAAENDGRYASMPPDRDMKIRWRRIEQESVME